MVSDFAATACLGLAIFQTFAVKAFPSQRIPHLLGEVEVVFGLWAAVYCVCLAFSTGVEESWNFVRALDFTEPAFVFVVMVISASRPVLNIAFTLVEAAARILPLPRSLAVYTVTLVLGPLLGSLITEPAAMTVTALLVLQRFFTRKVSARFRYLTLGLLFVNVSVGGTMTAFAAPPVLMVAGKWNWDAAFMLEHFAWRAVLACLLSTAVVSLLLRTELSALAMPSAEASPRSPPWWLTALHLVLLAGVVVEAHHPLRFVLILGVFLVVFQLTRRHQGELSLMSGLLVAVFLGAIVILGPHQRWWLEPVLTRLEALPLFLSAIALTGITDNAALTYLGAQVPSLSETSRYALVAGSVVGGGLTVIANAPNPVGYGLLGPSFGPEGIRPGRLFQSALIPTLIAGFCFWIL